MIFQWESQSASAYLKRLFSDETMKKIRDVNPNASYMDLLSVGNGAIRPAGASYRDNLAAGIYNDNGHEALNKLFEGTLGYCVEENQFVHTTAGKKRIADVEVGDIVFTKDGTSIVDNKFYTGVKECLRISTGVHSILCTKDHKLFADGEWRKAEEFKRGDYISTKQGDKIVLEKVVGIAEVGMKNVYDLTIRNEHNFICQGFVAHNCCFQEEIIDFLHTLCGFTMGEADVVRRCVDENTLVRMSDGSQKRIKDVKIGEYVVSYRDGKFVNNKVLDVYDNGYAEIIEVYTDDKKIECTGTHKFLTKSGYVEAYKLVEGKSEIYTINGKWEKVFTIIRCTKTKTHVYDLCVDNDHNYVANGLVVHNCFAKKTGTESAIPVIKDGGYLNGNKDHYIDGFVKTMKDKYGVEEDEANKLIENTLQVIIDASDYLFSKNHSDPYSWIGYICGYLRYYYPHEFISSALNIFKDNEEKSIAAINYAKKVGIAIKPIKFRHSRAEYNFDKETNRIFKGIASIKQMNAQVAEELYELRNKKYKSFIDLLLDLHENTSIKKNQLDIIIRLNFFEEFGDIKQLIKITDLFRELFAKNANGQFEGKKQLTKDKVNKLGLDPESVEKNSTKVTEKTYMGIRAYCILSEYAENLTPCKANLREIVAWQYRYLGYIDVMSNEYAGMALVTSIDTKYSPKAVLYSLKNGTSSTVKINKRTYSKAKIKNGSIIKIDGYERRPKVTKDENGNWVETGDTELWLTKYCDLGAI